MRFPKKMEFFYMNITKQNIAAIRLEQGKNDEGNLMYETVLSDPRRASGRYHPQTSVGAAKLG